MTKSNLLCLGTLAVVVVGLAFERYTTARELKSLRSQYDLISVAAAKARDRSAEARSQPAEFDRAPRFVASPRAAVSGSPEPTNPERSAQPNAEDAPTWADHAAHLDVAFSEQAEDRNWS